MARAHYQVILYIGTRIFSVVTHILKKTQLVETQGLLMAGIGTTRHAKVGLWENNHPGTGTRSVRSPSRDSFTRTPEKPT